MDIGKPKRIYTVEPLEDPVPQRAPVREPRPAPLPPRPQKQPEPARTP
jgi:hypothetical protein